MTPAGTSIDVQNGWEENTHTHTLKLVHLSTLYTFAACYMRFARRPASQEMRLDDIFSGLFGTPDGDLLDVASDEDVGLNVTRLISVPARGQLRRDWR